MKTIEYIKKHKTKFSLGLLIVIFWFFWQVIMKNIPNGLYLNSFSVYGTFLAGTLGVVLSAVNVLFLLYIWKEQREVMERQQFEQRFFNLLTMRDKARDEVRYVLGGINGQLSGVEAISKLAKCFNQTTDKYNDSQNHSERTRERKELYKDHRNTLRPYFDLILYIFKFVSEQSSLTKSQKNEYVNLLMVSTPHDEVMVWVLMKYDDNQFEENNQAKRFQDIIDEYNIFAGKMYDGTL